MSRRAWIGAVLCAGLLLAAALFGLRPDAREPAAPEPPEVAAAPAERPAPAAPAEAPAPALPKADATALQRHLEQTRRPGDAEHLARRMHEVARQEAAIARWDEGVAREELEARHIEPAVRRFFGELELEPVLRDGGLMEGLAVRRVSDGGAASRAGLAPGDVIVSLLDRELEDPAELPDLLARLPRRLPLCVERDAARRCLEIELAAAPAVP